MYGRLQPCKCPYKTESCFCRVPEGSVDVVLSYCHYSLNDTTLLDILPYLKRKGVGIINAGVLSMGLLTKHVSPPSSPPPFPPFPACCSL